MRKIRCSLSYHSTRLGEIPTFAGGVRDGVYGNPAPFATPPMLEADFQALITDYQTKRDAYKQGGLAQKGPFLNAKDQVMQGLDDLAEYVDTVADGDANVITLGGFVPTKGTASEVPDPLKPTGVTIKRGDVGQLLAECDNQDYAVSYGCIMTANEPLPGNVVMNGKGQLLVSEDGMPPIAGDDTPISASLGFIVGTVDLNVSRKKKFINLIPGVTYHFVFFAVNAQGVSALSVSESLMCA